MEIKIPELSVVVLIGVSGSGKSTFASQHFLPTEVVSSDACRGVVSDDEGSQAATPRAFELVHTIMRLRLEGRRMVVVDATNVQPESRRALLEIARAHHALAVAIVLDVDEQTCHERNAQRADRSFGRHVVRNQQRALKRSLRGLRREGFRQVYTLSSQEEIDQATITRTPLWTNRKQERGPFDIIGDVHGCFDELCALLTKLGYEITRDEAHEHMPWAVKPPQGRKAVFVGDLVDRGPGTPDVLKLVMRMVREETALCVAGNHDDKLLRALRGKKVQLKHGLDLSMAQIDAEPEGFKREAIHFLDGLVSHYMLDGGALCVAHAGLKEELQGRASGKVRSFALYGETTGEVDEFGLPVRLNWAAQYRGEPMVVYGHTPTPVAQWLNHTICVDTGCVFGGHLSALRYPEQELVSVQAAKVYAEPSRPLITRAEADQAQGLNDLSLTLEDVQGKQRIQTELFGTVIVREQESAAALEVMSRFAIDPRWLIYLPPTMSPTKTSKEPGLLEHPAQALEYYRAAGIKEVIAQKKHMGSRALLIVTREDEVAKTRFGLGEPSPGVIYTRTGRAFFNQNNAHLEPMLLERLRHAMNKSGLWERLETDWVLLDAELMPWSAKAQALLRDQYAAVGAAATHATHAALTVLEQALARGVVDAAQVEQMRGRQEAAKGLVEAYRRYCWPVESVDDYRVAPFHLLASEGQNHLSKPHTWHMERIGELVEAERHERSPILEQTPYLRIELGDESQHEALYQWWEELTAQGFEGVVVKPLEGIVRGSKGLIQPALKCRGREYLRMIYGPEYTQPEHLERLRARGLGRKRELALREFALGALALDRFVARAPLRHVHQCAFGVLALESEAIDPRL